MVAMLVEVVEVAAVAELAALEVGQEEQAAEAVTRAMAEEGWGMAVAVAPAVTAEERKGVCRNLSSQYHRGMRHTMSRALRHHSPQ